MCIDSLDAVAISEVPAAGALRLIETELAGEVGAVRVLPFAVDELSVFESSNILLLGVVEDVGSLSVFLAICPVSRIDIFIKVGHDTLTMSLTILPVTVVVTNLSIRLSADTVLLVALPLSLISDRLGFLALSLSSVCIFTLTFTNLL